MKFIQSSIQGIPMLSRQIMNDSSPYDRINFPRSMTTSHRTIIKNDLFKLICEILWMRYVLSNEIVRELNVRLIEFWLITRCILNISNRYDVDLFCIVCMIHATSYFAQAIIVFNLSYLNVWNSTTTLYSWSIILLLTYINKNNR